jgi:uncharacterized protein (DUF1697 family)
MTRYFAFLRGINVGGHNAKKEQLCKPFEDLGLTNVSTFIASGNVIFETDETDSAKLEQRIERALRDALGYDAATFLRTNAELADIAAYTPFPDAESQENDSQLIVFLRAAPDADVRRRIQKLSNDQDLLHLHQRELYWLRRGSLMDSTIATKQFDAAFDRAPTTTRNANTIRRLAAKYPVTSGSHQ